ACRAMGSCSWPRSIRRADAQTFGGPSRASHGPVGPRTGGPERIEADERLLSKLGTQRRFWLNGAGFPGTERRRSRTYPAVGYTTWPVLKFARVVERILFCEVRRRPTAIEVAGANRSAPFGGDWRHGALARPSALSLAFSRTIWARRRGFALPFPGGAGAQPHALDSWHIEAFFDP